MAQKFQVDREALREVLLALGYKKAVEADDERLQRQVALALGRVEADGDILDPLTASQKSLFERIIGVVDAAGSVDAVEFEMTSAVKKKAADEDDDEPVEKPVKAKRTVIDDDDDEPAEKPAKKTTPVVDDEPEEEPKAKKAVEDDEPEEKSAKPEAEAAAVPAKRGRGRPPKDPAAKSAAAKSADADDGAAPAKDADDSQVLYGFSPGRNRAYLAGVVVSRFGDKIAEQGGITKFEADFLASLVGEDTSSEHYQHLAGAMHVRRAMVQEDSVIIEVRYAKNAKHRFTSDGKQAASEILAAAK